jgi:glycosyltransferase involved in cell wall biosynthesis
VSIPSGVPTERLRASAPPRAEARRHLGLDPSAFVVMGLGRLIRIKGFDLAVRALPRVRGAIPTARLLLVGDGPERPALEALAAALRVADRLRMTGRTADVAPHLAAADAVVMPSRKGMGRVLVEAMALGRPVVASPSAGSPRSSPTPSAGG